VGNISHSRGYGYENLLVTRINKCLGWKANRFGGATATFPDIIAVNNKTSTLLAIEAKTTATKDSLFVPHEQRKRCDDILKMFGRYENKVSVLAFKFMKKRRNKGVYEKRKIMEYYKVINWALGYSVKCTYNGWIFGQIKEHITQPHHGADYKMPWQAQETLT